MNEHHIGMKNKVGIVLGLANDRSYAYYITEALLKAGSRPVFGYLPGEKNERRIRSALEQFGLEEPWLQPCDVCSDEDLDALFDRLKYDFGEIDYIVHSVAFANKEYLELGNFHKTPRSVWNQALETSAYSLVAVAQRAVPLMNNGGSIISLSYLGADRVVPGYNVMGIAKSALESSTRYLAAELGGKGIRVNCISGGPLRTLSAMGISNFDKILTHNAEYSPLRRNISGEEVGHTAAFLLSSMASGITGEVIYVDAGFHTLACLPPQ